MLFERLSFRSLNIVAAGRSLIFGKRYSTKQVHFKPVTHIISDLDGLLLDTETMYEQADTEILRRYGRDYSWRLKERLMGCTDDESARIVVEYNGLHITPEDYRKQFNDVLSRILPSATFKPGAEKLIRYIHKNELPAAICTGASMLHFKWKTSNHEHLFSLFDHVVTVTDEKDEIKGGKPAPDCFLVCASRFKQPPAEPANVLVFEDSPNGVEAARAAGMQIVLVPDDTRVDEETREKATVCLDSLEHFDPELFGLPKL